MPRCTRSVSVSEVIAAYPSWSSEDQERLRNFLGCQEELELRVANAIELVAMSRKLSRTDTPTRRRQEDLERDGLTDEEIARTMHCTVWTVQQRRKRARRKKLPPRKA